MGILSPLMQCTKNLLERVIKEKNLMGLNRPTPFFFSCCPRNRNKRNKEFLFDFFSVYIQTK